MAWTGIVSILLPKGVTSHKTFKLSFDLTSIKTSFIKLDSHKKRLRQLNVAIRMKRAFVVGSSFRDI